MAKTKKAPRKTRESSDAAISVGTTLKKSKATAKSGPATRSLGSDKTKKIANAEPTEERAAFHGYYTETAGLAASFMARVSPPGASTMQRLKPMYSPVPSSLVRKQLMRREEEEDDIDMQELDAILSNVQSYSTPESSGQPPSSQGQQGQSTPMSDARHQRQLSHTGSPHRPHMGASGSAVTPPHGVQGGVTRTCMLGGVPVLVHSAPVLPTTPAGRSKITPARAAALAGAMGGAGPSMTTPRPATNISPSLSHPGPASADSDSLPLSRYVSKTGHLTQQQPQQQKLQQLPSVREVSQQPVRSTTSSTSPSPSSLPETEPQHPPASPQLQGPHKAPAPPHTHKPAPTPAQPRPRPVGAAADSPGEGVDSPDSDSLPLMRYVAQAQPQSTARASKQPTPPPPAQPAAPTAPTLQAQQAQQAAPVARTLEMEMEVGPEASPAPTTQAPPTAGAAEGVRVKKIKKTKKKKALLQKVKKVMKGKKGAAVGLAGGGAVVALEGGEGGVKGAMAPCVGASPAPAGGAGVLQAAVAAAEWAAAAAAGWAAAAAKGPEAGAAKAGRGAVLACPTRQGEGRTKAVSASPGAPQPLLQPSPSQSPQQAPQPSPHQVPPAPPHQSTMSPTDSEPLVNFIRRRQMAMADAPGPAPASAAAPPPSLLATAAAAAAASTPTSKRKTRAAVAAKGDEAPIRTCGAPAHAAAEAGGTAAIASASPPITSHAPQAAATKVDPPPPLPPTSAPAVVGHSTRAADPPQDAKPHKPRAATTSLQAATTSLQADPAKPGARTKAAATGAKVVVGGGGAASKAARRRLLMGQEGGDKDVGAVALHQPGGGGEGGVSAGVSGGAGDAGDAAPHAVHPTQGRGAGCVDAPAPSLQLPRQAAANPLTVVGGGVKKVGAAVGVGSAARRARLARLLRSPGLAAPAAAPTPTPAPSAAVAAAPAPAPAAELTAATATARASGLLPPMPLGNGLGSSKSKKGSACDTTVTASEEQRASQSVRPLPPSEEAAEAAGEAAAPITGGHQQPASVLTQPAPHSASTSSKPEEEEEEEEEEAAVAAAVPVAAPGTVPGGEAGAVEMCEVAEGDSAPPVKGQTELGGDAEMEVGESSLQDGMMEISPLKEDPSVAAVPHHAKPRRQAVESGPAGPPSEGRAKGGAGRDALASQREAREKGEGEAEGQTVVRAVQGGVALSLQQAAAGSPVAATQAEGGPAVSPLCPPPSPPRSARNLLSEFGATATPPPQAQLPQQRQQQQDPQPAAPQQPVSQPASQRAPGVEGTPLPGKASARARAMAAALLGSDKKKLPGSQGTGKASQPGKSPLPFPVLFKTPLSATPTPAAESDKAATGCDQPAMCPVASATASKDGPAPAAVTAVTAVAGAVLVAGSPVAMCPPPWKAAAGAAGGDAADGEQAVAAAMGPQRMPASRLGPGASPLPRSFTASAPPGGATELPGAAVPGSCRPAPLRRGRGMAMAMLAAAAAGDPASARRSGVKAGSVKAGEGGDGRQPAPTVPLTASLATGDRPDVGADAGGVRLAPAATATPTAPSPLSAPPAALLTPDSALPVAVGETSDALPAASTPLHASTPLPSGAAGRGLKRAVNGTPVTRLFLSRRYHRGDGCEGEGGEAGTPTGEGRGEAEAEGGSGFMSRLGKRRRGEGTVQAGADAAASNDAEASAADVGGDGAGADEVVSADAGSVDQAASGTGAAAVLRPGRHTSRKQRQVARRVLPLPHRAAFSLAPLRAPGTRGGGEEGGSQGRDDEDEEMQDAVEVVGAVEEEEVVAGGGAKEVEGGEAGTLSARGDIEASSPPSKAETTADAAAEPCDGAGHHDDVDDVRPLRRSIYMPSTSAPPSDDVFYDAVEELSESESESDVIGYGRDDDDDDDGTRENGVDDVSPWAPPAKVQRTMAGAATTASSPAPGSGSSSGVGRARLAASPAPRLIRRPWPASAPSAARGHTGAGPASLLPPQPAPRQHPQYSWLAPRYKSQNTDGSLGSSHVRHVGGFSGASSGARGAQLAGVAGGVAGGKGGAGKGKGDGGIGEADEGGVLFVARHLTRQPSLRKPNAHRDNRPTQEMEVREAALNLRLACAWHEERARWARMDMGGLEVGLTPTPTYRARYDSALSRYRLYRGEAAAAALLSRCDQEWDHLARLRQAAAARAQLTPRAARVAEQALSAVTAAAGVSPDRPVPSLLPRPEPCADGPADSGPCRTPPTHNGKGPVACSGEGGVGEGGGVEGDGAVGGGASPTLGALPGLGEVGGSQRLRPAPTPTSILAQHIRCRQFRHAAGRRVKFAEALCAVREFERDGDSGEEGEVEGVPA